MGLRLKEVKIMKRPVQDPKCPPLLCCGREMKQKEGAIKAEDIKDIVKGRYDAYAERGGREGVVCCSGETPASPSCAAEHGLYTSLR